MEKGKLIPLITAIVLFIIAIFIFIYNQNKDVRFDKLIVTYKDQKNEYDTLNVDDVIVVNNVSFWVVSTIKNSIILNTSDYLKYEDKKITEIEVELNETKSICFEENDCMLLQLI